MPSPSVNPYDTTPEDLPASLPVFPLSAVLLLPRGRLPLNIFEPRYLNMTLDALASPDRLIGMIQPVDPDCRACNPQLYPVGCAGRITQFSETGDGRFLITLTGVSRFRLGGEVPTTRGYRRFTADWTSYAGDFTEVPCGGLGAERPRLLRALKSYFCQQGLDADWAEVERTADEKLITTLSMICPFSAPEKQALLEAPDLIKRAQTMMALIEMALLDDKSGETARH